MSWQKSSWLSSLETPPKANKTERRACLSRSATRYPYFCSITMMELLRRAFGSRATSDHLSSCKSYSSHRSVAFSASIYPPTIATLRSCWLRAQPKCTRGTYMPCFAVAIPSELTYVTELKVLSIFDELAPPRRRQELSWLATIWHKQLFAREATWYYMRSFWRECSAYNQSFRSVFW